MSSSSSSSSSARASASASSGGGSSSSSLMRSSLARSKSSSNSSSENLPPRTLARVAREVKGLLENPPDGVRLVLDLDTGMPSSLDNLVAEIEGPTGTPFEGKYFQLKLVLSVDFPASPPRGFFLTKIYHPNVDSSTGAICVNTLKKDWTSTTTFSHVLSVIRCLLIVPFPESSLNDEAGKLFMDSYGEYSRRARLMADVHGRPFAYNHGADGGDGDGDDVLGDCNEKPSSGSGSGGGKKGGALDMADSPVQRGSLKRGVSSPPAMSSSTSSSSSSMVGGGGGGPHSTRSLSSTSVRSNSSSVSVLNRSGSVGSGGNGIKKVGADGKKKAAKKKKNGLGRL
mmetsp:Transcript_34736/g.70273  ORF Transcript_34736/g.70273 Transcript_34736/m.70273 type:complete len:341 (-) Transcript_34736:1488-2510(-)